jgi:hypothetical protein
LGSIDPPQGIVLPAIKHRPIAKVKAPRTATDAYEDRRFAVHRARRLDQGAACG